MIELRGGGGGGGGGGSKGVIHDTSAIGKGHIFQSNVSVDVYESNTCISFACCAYKNTLHHLKLVAD